MIKRKSARRKKRIEIDLTDQQGNAFVLLSYTEDFCRQLGKDSTPIVKDMMSSDYEHLLKVFDREFGDLVTLYR